MTTPAAQPQQQQPPPQVMGALIVVLLSGVPPAAMVAHALPLLARLGIPPAAGVAALSMVLPHTPETVTPPGPAEAYAQAVEIVRRAQYVVKAGERMTAPDHNIADERRHMAAHLNAQRARTEAAKQVDKAAEQHGPTLGWYAIRDERTTPECRAAHGANFSVTNPPKLGWPGTLHGGTCRCKAGPAHNTALTVDEATAAVKEHAVIPFAVVLSQGQD